MVNKVYTPRYMNPETLTQSPALSRVSLERRNALQSVVDLLTTRVGPSVPKEHLSEKLLIAANEYLKEIEGNNYRLEQAVLKVKECLECEVAYNAEMAKRLKELEGILPGTGARLIASNDSHFNNPEALAQKYNVAP